MWLHQQEVWKSATVNMAGAACGQGQVSCRPGHVLRLLRAKVHGALMCDIAMPHQQQSLLAAWNVMASLSSFRLN